MSGTVHMTSEETSEMPFGRNIDSQETSRKESRTVLRIMILFIMITSIF